MGTVEHVSQHMGISPATSKVGPDGEISHDADAATSHGSIDRDEGVPLVRQEGQVVRDVPVRAAVDEPLCSSLVGTAGDLARTQASAAEAEAIASRGFLSDDCEWVDRQRDVVRDLRVRSALALSTAHLAFVWMVNILRHFLVS